MSNSKPPSKQVTRHRVTSLNLLQYAAESRIEGHFNDVTIVADTEHIAANRLVLSCHSEFFQKMFKCNMKEKYEHSVEIKGYDGKAVKSLVNYVYTGSIDIDEENVMKLLAAADYMLLQDARHFCFEFLLSNIAIDNWFVLLNTISLYKEDEFKIEVYRYISTHFDEIAQTDDIQMVSHDDLKECISRLDISKVTQVSIFQVIMNWMKGDHEVRNNEVLDLFEMIRIELLPYELIESILDDERITHNVACHKYLSKALLQILKNQQDDGYESKIIISAGGKETASKVFVVYNLHGKTFSGHFNFPARIARHTLVKTKYCVYCVGGSDEEGIGVCNKVWMLKKNDRLMNWEQVAPMKNSRSAMGATEYHGDVVVAGGLGTDTANSVEFCNILTQTWKPLAPLNQSRYDHGLVSCNGSLYAFGGYDGFKVLSSAENLTDFDGRWKEVQPMLTTRTLLAAVTCANALYAIGGRSSNKVSTTLKSVEKYTPNDNQWKYVSEMNVERRGHAACVMRGKIYVVGGKDANNKVVKTIECYDPAQDSWIVVGETEQKLYLHAIVAL